MVSAPVYYTDYIHGYHYICDGEIQNEKEN